MSVASPSKRPRPLPTSNGGRLGSDQLIEARIAEACQALWQAEVMRTLLRLAVGSIIGLLAWIVIDQWIYSPGPAVRSLAFVAAAGLLIAYFIRKVLPLFGSSVRPEYAARSLERDLPELRQSLTSYVTLRGDRQAGDLRSRVVRSIGAETAGRLRAHDTLPLEATGTLRWWIAAIAGLAVLVAYAFLSPKNSLQSAARLAAPLAKIEAPRRVSIRDVQPGNSEAIAGRSVEISASVEGLRGQEQAICRWELPTGWQELDLVHDPSSQRHHGQLQLPHSAGGIVSYSILAGDASAGPFQLTVQDVPVVALESVHYQPPTYTGLAPYTNSSGAITAVDGTTVEILATTNRAVGKAKIEFNPRQLGGRMQATAGATEMEIDPAGTSLSVAFPLRSAQGRSAAVELEDYRILVWDAAGQGNPDPIVYPIRVVPDLPPEVSITVPASTPKEVPLDAQQIIEVHASDPDFGLKLISLEIRAGIDRIQEPVLWESPKGEKGHQVAEFRLRPSELQLRAGDTVQVVAIAVDNRSSEVHPNIEPNVVRTDPITLKITAGGEVPESNDPNADGLSSPDPDDQQGADSDQQDGAAGDSGAGGSGAGGSGQNNQTQSGSDQGEGTEGQGGSGESGEESGSGAGGSNSEGESSQPGQQGQPDEDASGSSDANDADATMDDGSPGSQSDASAGDNTPTDGDQGQQGDTSPEAEGGEPNGSGQGAQDSTGTPSQAGSAAETGDDQGASEGEQGSGDPTQRSPNGSSTGSRDSAGGSEGANADPSADSSSQPAGQPQQAPEHDGEAFERIRDFLEKQQQGDQDSSGSGRNSQPTPGSQSNSGQQAGSDQQGSSGSQSDQAQGSEGTGTENQTAENGSEGNPPSGNRETENGQTGSRGAENTETGSDNGSDGSTNDGSSESGRGDQAAGQQESASSDAAQDSGQDSAGDQTTDGQSSKQGANSESASTSDSASPSESGQPNESTSSPGEQGSQTASDEQASPGSESDPRAKPGSSGSTTQTASPTSDPTGESNTTAQASSGGAGDTGQQSDASDQPPPPPDPVNLDYAKQATDLVLDYLEQTRENPDPELLDELQWSRDDLQRFAERWRQMRELSKQSGEAGRQEMEEALKSLGLRPQTGAAKTTRESSDALRGIRDAGNRQPPPAAFRDAFDAFRRAVGQQQ